MLKHAFSLGYQEAIKEAEMSPAQMQAAQLAGGVGGGLAGAAGGGLLGKQLGSYIGDTFGYDEGQAGAVGGGIGGLLGAGAGGLLGSQLPRAFGKTTSPQAEASPPSATRTIGGSMGIPMGADEGGFGALPQGYGDYDPYAEQLYQQAMSQGYPNDSYDNNYDYGDGGSAY